MIGVEKLTVMNVQDLNIQANTIYLHCDIARPNLYNGRNQSIIYSITKSARTTEWLNKLNTWYADNIIMHNLWDFEHTMINFWLTDANSRVLPFEYMALAVRLSD